MARAGPSRIRVRSMDEMTRLLAPSLSGVRQTQTYGNRRAACVQSRTLTALRMDMAPKQHLHRDGAMLRKRSTPLPLTGRIMKALRRRRCLLNYHRMAVMVDSARSGGIPVGGRKILLEFYSERQLLGQRAGLLSSLLWCRVAAGSKT